MTGVSTLVGDGHAHVEDSQGLGMDRARDIPGSNTGESPIFMGKLWRKSLVERILGLSIAGFDYQARRKSVLHQ